jgi:hypothetical protein
MNAIPSHLSNLDEILNKICTPDEKNFELVYYFDHNLSTLTKGQIVQICQKNTSDHDKMTMVDSIIDNKVDQLFSSLPIIITNISDQEIRKCCLFVIADSKLITDDHYVLLYHCIRDEEWRINVRYQYSKNHTTSEVNKFHRSIAYFPPPIFSSPSFYETPEGRNVGIIHPKRESQTFHRY